MQVALCPWLYCLVNKIGCTEKMTWSLLVAKTIEGVYFIAKTIEETGILEFLQKLDHI